jgi:xanthine dehydrogenase YagT iron-sulfur-binding subunit
MPENKKKEGIANLSRRQFLKDAGLVVGGTAVSSVFLLSACGKEIEVTKTVTTTAPGSTITNTTTAPGTTVTSTAPGTTVTKYTCPFDNQEFSTVAELKAHIESQHAEIITKPEKELTKLNINGKVYEVDIEPHWTLQRTLQYKLGLTGSAKTMCDRGACGSCTVIIDGRAVLSCSVLAVECEGKIIETIEGVAADAKWDPLIKSYMKWDGAQCGYCTPGFVVTAKALLEKNPNPTEAEVMEAMAGNLCRCGTYPRHPIAVVEAASQIGGN